MICLKRKCLVHFKNAPYKIQCQSAEYVRHDVTNTFDVTRNKLCVFLPLNEKLRFFVSALPRVWLACSWITSYSNVDQSVCVAPAHSRRLWQVGIFYCTTYDDDKSWMLCGQLICCHGTVARLCFFVVLSGASNEAFICLFCQRPSEANRGV